MTDKERYFRSNRLFILVIIAKTIGNWVLGIVAMILSSIIVSLAAPFFDKTYFILLPYFGEEELGKQIAQYQFGVVTILLIIASCLIFIYKWIISKKKEELFLLFYVELSEILYEIFTVLIFGLSFLPLMIEMLSTESGKLYTNDVKELSLFLLMGVGPVYLLLVFEKIVVLFFQKQIKYQMKQQYRNSLNSSTSHLEDNN
ncbi:MAG: hypothetical protein ABS948_11970 [Solibacillus sp.]